LQSVSVVRFIGQLSAYTVPENRQEVKTMLNWIRYRILMRRLRGEIARVVNGEKPNRTPEKIKSPSVTACKACGSIV